MREFATYWLWPNPANWNYSDPKVQLVLAGCAVLIVAAIAVRFWRARLRNPSTRKLSASWSTTLITFGIIGFVLAVSRVETIQFISMRLLWLLWLISFALYAVYQIVIFRRRHYVVVEKKITENVMDRYLPKKKNR